MGKIANYPPYEAYTMEDEISSGKNIEMSHGNMQFKTMIDDMIVPYSTLVNRFHGILTPYITNKQFTDDEYKLYYQNPKLLSYDLYGTPELWSSILYINNMVSTVNFTKKNIKIFNINIFEALDEIMTIYRDDITTNQNSVYSE